MQSPGRGAPRWLRAAVLVALTVLVSIGGHAWAGGAVHVSTPMLLGVLALGAMCVAAAEVRRSFPEILAVVLLAQPALHLLASMGAHSHAAPNDPAATAVAVAVEPGMVLAHVAAALLVSALLADAERLLWLLADLLRPAAVPHPPVPLWRVPRAVPVRVPHPVRPALQLRCAPRCRRGPPVSLALT